MNTTVTNRIQWVDSARGLSIALVVLYHSVLSLRAGGYESGSWSTVMALLATLRMPLFFFLAGMFAHKWIQGSWRGILRNKVALFLWTFALWLVISRVVYDLVPNLRAHGREINPLRAILDGMLTPTHGWFLVSLALMFVLARLLRRVPPAIQLAAALVLSVAVVEFSSPFPAAYEKTLLYLVFFLAGLHLRGKPGNRWSILELGARRGVPSILIRAAVIVCWVAAWYVASKLGIKDDALVLTGLRILAIAAGICLGTFLVRFTPLASAGRATLPIYVMHGITVNAIVIVVGLPLISLQIPVVSAVLPLVVGGIAIVLCHWVAIAAKRSHLGWLYETPRPLLQLFDRVWPDRRSTAAEPSPSSRPGSLL